MEKTKIEVMGEKVMAAARRFLPSKIPEAVIEINKDKAGWKVLLEVVEHKVTPPSQDIIGIYEFNVDGNGNVSEYKRVKLRRRSDKEEKEIE